MKRLRFICFASLVAVILLLGGISDAQPMTGGDTPVSTASCISATNSTGASATATLTITMRTPPIPDD